MYASGVSFGNVFVFWVSITPTARHIKEHTCFWILYLPAHCLNSWYFKLCFTSFQRLIKFCCNPFSILSLSLSCFCVCLVLWGRPFGRVFVTYLSFCSSRATIESLNHQFHISSVVYVGWIPAYIPAEFVLINFLDNFSFPFFWHEKTSCCSRYSTTGGFWINVHFPWFWTQCAVFSITRHDTSTVLEKWNLKR